MAQGREINKKLKDNIKTSDLPAKFLVINPIAEITKSMQNKDYFGAFTNAVAFFEYLGYKKLVKSLKGKINEEKLSRFSVSKIVILLFCLDIIKQPTYAKMFEVIKVRNDLIHPKEDVGLRYTIDDDKAERLVEKAKEVISLLSE